MEFPKIIIAIDGYSSTGKSTFAKIIASKLGFIHIDSGALYRAVTLYALKNGLVNSENKINESKLKELLPDLNIELRLSGSGSKSETYVNGENVEDRIRMMDVSGSVSPVATLAFVRDFVDRFLRAYGKKGAIVMDGRDIGTNVFPSAHLKIFMTADLKVRAERRMNEIRLSGKQVAFDDVIKNLQERDFIDRNREVSPLKQAPDAYVLDNTYMTIEDQIVWLNEILVKKWGIGLK